MSDETGDQVRRAYDTFNRRDWDAFRRLMDRDVTVESRLVQMDGGYRGYDGLRRWWDEVFETIPDYRVEIEDLREVGDIVLVQARGLGHGAASGTPVVDPFWHAIEMKDGRCTWWRNCSTESEALEAIAKRSASAGGRS
jgi:ketosteroid isomerase-like protein